MSLGIYLAITSAPQGGVASFSPADLGEVKSHMQGNTAVYTAVDSLVVDYLPDAGTLTGQYDANTNAHPVSTGVGSLKAPIIRGDRAAQHDGTASDFSRLHNLADDASLTLRFYMYEVSAASVLFATHNGGASNTGFRLRVASGALRCEISNGTTLTAITSGVALAAGWHTAVFRKTADAIRLSVDDETDVTGTITSATNNAPNFLPIIGNNSIATAPFNSLIAEIVMHAVDIGGDGATSMEAYMSDLWSDTPDFSLLQLNGVDVIQVIDISLGVTEAGGFISAVGDQGGYNNNVLESTNQPALVTSDPAFSDKDTADFDGSNDKLRIAAFTGGTLTQPYVMACCGTWDFDSGTGPIIYGSSTAAQGIRHQGGKPTLTGNAGNSNMTANAPSSGTVFSMYGKFDGTSAQGVISVDGVATETDTLNTGTSSLPGVTLGAANTGSVFWDGKGALFVILSGAPSDADRDLLMDFLNTRAEITPL